MINDGIIKHPDNTYSVFVHIQDGIESEGGILSEKEAIERYQKIHMIMNHNENMIPHIYELHPKTVYELVKIK